jgi:aspartate racemase
MKKIGIVGGLGPESTVDYYRTMIEECRELKAGAVPEIIIYSLNLKDFPPIEQRTAIVRWLVHALQSLHRAGADFAIISANTPHIVFDAVEPLSPLPLLSIVEETEKAVQSLGLRKVGLLGTRVTMSSDFYQKVFTRDHITIVVPDRNEQDYIEAKLMSEIMFNKILEDTRQGLLQIVKRMVDEDGIQGLILGCTELPLILTEDAFGIPFLNTTHIHVRSAIRYCLGGHQG